ncbi:MULTISPECIES: SDR family NAD(P)-dependent oxidoreductase [Sorangium]|uniref:SDR family short chain oxidoreductase n=1 Tax=Sorangium cellulosum (strain So ce56) TaxID=448385 RepID=A9GST4_SORC5|nr:SDR family oxidoreductase [Sorangium cellulosum]CAN96854.1 SDR family short chain oxidoreductase [Sorangium cellulosum So ce56]
MPERTLAIVVLGGSRGIGRAIVARALAEGHRVFAGARDERALLALQQGAAPEGAGRLGTGAVDVGDDASQRAFFGAARAFLGGIDVVVNNAAREGYGRLDEMALEEVEAIVRTNLLGVILGCRHAAQAMGDGGGHIINVGSEVSFRAVPMKSVYCATKFAVRGLSDALELELAPRGIRVSQVHPGWVDTGLHEDERRRRGSVSRPHDGGVPVERVAESVAALWRAPRAQGGAPLRLRLRSVVGELFPAWARWRTRRAFGEQLREG